MGKDEVLVVTRLDRRTRTKDLLNTLGTVADRGAGFRSLRDKTPHGRLMLNVLVALPSSNSS